MKVNKFLRFLCFVLSFVMLISMFGISSSADAANNASNSTLEDMKKYLSADSYATYNSRYSSAGVPAGDKIYSATFDSTSSGASAVEVDLTTWTGSLGLDQDDYQSGVVYSPSDGLTSYTVNVDQTGMYYIKIEYYTISQTVNSIERKLYIDGDLPFQEAKLLSLTKYWAYDYQVTSDGVSFTEDINGNDLTPAISQVSRWGTYMAQDSDGYSSDYYKFYITAGTHTISLDSIREGMVVGSIKLVPINDPDYGTISYADYLSYVTNTLGATRVSNNAYTKIQAEYPVLVSDSSVVMSNNRSSAITEPTSPTADLYNTIGETSYKNVGQWAAYSFTVSETGLYCITNRYLQTALEGMFVSRSVRIYGGYAENANYKYGLADGTATIPFEEAFSNRFNYSKDWKVESLNDGKNTFEFYFESGVTYTIYYEVSLGALAESLEKVETALTVLNDCYLQILKLTGSDPDAYQDYNFTAVLPDVVWYLNYEAVELQNIRDEFEAICGTTGSKLATLDNIIRLILTMATDESEIAGNLATFKSYLGTLGTWLADVKTSTIILDYITVQSPNAPLGKAKANFFQSVWFEIRAFFSSFFTDYDQMGVVVKLDENANPLNVWLATGRDQSKVVRNLIDSKFADYCDTDSNFTGGELAVSLKLVTGGTLLPSILAGKGPEVYMGLDSTTLMNYAIRDAVIPISDMSDFSNIKDYFHTASIDSITLLGDTYGLPMTMSFAMMFYRSDVLVNLGATVPETWDELLSLLPALQANNMDIGLTYVLALDFFLYQNGGNMWRFIDDVDYQGAQIALDTDEGLSAFEFCCQLYTDYSFPVAFSAANRFRTGEMPVVISDYVSTYNTLIVYATELDGLWSFSHIPGIQQFGENGEVLLNPDGTRNINYTAIADVSSAIVTKNGEKRIGEAWEYLKWVTSADYTAEYANRMVAILGPSAKYAAANLDALENMAWTSAEVKAIREQLDQLDAIVRYPGYYIVGRYTNFAFLNAVNNKADPVESLRSYISTINAEISRKREEFNMKTLGTGEVPPSYQSD